MRTLVLCSALLLGLAFTGCGGGSGGQPDGVGNTCAEDADCVTGTCYLGPGGGYCTTECENEGSTEECPVDTICKPIQGGPARCLLVCGSETSCDGDADCADDFCPVGSSCVNVSDSEFDGCEPDPQ